MKGRERLQDSEKKKKLKKLKSQCLACKGLGAKN